MRGAGLPVATTVGELGAVVLMFVTDTGTPLRYRAERG